MNLKLNYDLLGYRKGTIINVDILSPKIKTYFRRRLQDAKYDNCVEIVSSLSNSKAKNAHCCQKDTPKKPHRLKKAGE